MRQKAKVFNNGRSQAVRLPAEFRFPTREVYIRRDPNSGDVILSRKPPDWKAIFAALDRAKIPADFMDEGDRDHSVPTDRNIL
jgi:antitoxin VapB